MSEFWQKSLFSSFTAACNLKLSIDQQIQLQNVIISHEIFPCFILRIFPWQSMSSKPCPRQDLFDVVPPSPNLLDTAKASFPCQSLAGVPGGSNLFVIAASSSISSSLSPFFFFFSFMQGQGLWQAFLFKGSWVVTGSFDFLVAKVSRFF